MEDFAQARGVDPTVTSRFRNSSNNEGINTLYTTTRMMCIGDLDHQNDSIADIRLPDMMAYYAKKT